MRKHNLAFIDIEITGLDVIEHEIIEIGCITTTPEFKIIEKFELKVKPKHIENANPVSLKISHYKEEEWVHSYKLEEAMKILSKKTKDCIMIGQNVCFDSSFLEHAFIKTKTKNTMHYHKLDTISIAWAKLHKKSSVTRFSLRDLCEYFDIKNEHPHRALSDASATFELYKKLMSL